VSEEEREYLNEMIRSLNNQLVDALRERDAARRDYCMTQSHVDEEYGRTTLPEEIADDRGWDCFKKDEKVVKTLKGVVVSKGKAVPPKFELDEDDK